MYFPSNNCTVDLLITLCFREANPFFNKDILLGKRDGIVRHNPNDTFVQLAGWLCGIFETAGLDAHYAAPAGQPDFVDVGR